MRIDLRVPEDRGYAIFKPLGNKMLQAFRLFMHLVPGVFQNIMKEQLEQPMMTHKLPGSALSSRRQPNTPVLLIRNQSRALRGEPLNHTRYRGRPYPQSLGERIRCDRQLIGSPQFEDRLQVIVYRFRSRKRGRFRWHYLGS